MKIKYEAEVGDRVVFTTHNREDKAVTRITRYGILTHLGETGYERDTVQGDDGHVYYPGNWEWELDLPVPAGAV